MEDIVWTDEQIEEARVDKKRLEAIVRHLKAIVILLNESGLAIYVASDTANVHQKTRPPHADYLVPDHECVIAYVNGPFDGGDW